MEKINNGKISTFEIPLEDKKQEWEIPNPIVVKAKECCLTCGGYKRLRWTERTDGKRVLKEVCLYCITRHHTKSNETDH